MQTNRENLVLTADAFRFVAVDGEALDFSDFAHPIEGLAVGFDEIFPLGHFRV